MSLSKEVTRAIAYVAIFFEFSDDTIVDPDAAVMQMEQLAVFLREMDSSQKQEFIQNLSRISEDEPNPDRAEFISSLGENLGIA